MQSPSRRIGFAPRALSLSLSLLLLGAPGGRAEANPTVRYRLDEAVATAFEQSPVLRAATSELDAARGRLEQARTYPFNPEVGGAVGARRAETNSTTDFGLAVSQEIEIGGQRGRRASAAAAELLAAEAHLAGQRRLLAARVGFAFSAAVRARDLVEIELADAALARQNAEFSQKRFDAGATSVIERNLGAVAAVGAERNRLVAAAVYREAQAVLAEAIGLPAATIVEPGETSPPDMAQPPPLVELLVAAEDNRADLLELRHFVVAAEARKRLAEADTKPNLRLEGFIDREDGTDTIAGVGLSIGLPVFNRNRGNVADARADVLRAQAEQEALGLTVEQQVVSADARLLAAIGSLERLQEGVIGTLQENLALLEGSFAAGKIGAMELLVFRREFVQSQRDQVEAVAEACQARIALDLATGQISVPVPIGDEARDVR